MNITDIGNTILAIARDPAWGAIGTLTTIGIALISKRERKTHSHQRTNVKKTSKVFHRVFHKNREVIHTQRPFLAQTTSLKKYPLFELLYKTYYLK